MRWYTGRPAPGTYVCTWQVINNFALLDIELEREFRFILRYLMEIKCGTPRYRYALVIHERRSVCECDHAFTLKREICIAASSPVKRKSAYPVYIKQ